MTKNARQLWCTKCSSWKWANRTKCYCRAKESGKPLNGWSDLSDASRQDLQATLKKLEGAKQNAAAAPHAVSALEERIQQVKDAIYRCDPLHEQISKLQTAIGRAESTVKNRREQLWQSQQALAKAQDHLCELQRRLEDVMHQQGRGGPRVRYHGSAGWMYLVVGCRLTRFGRRRSTFSGVVTTVLAVLCWLSAPPGLAQIAVCRRRSVGQVCGDAEIHWQHHDAVQ